MLTTVLIAVFAGNVVSTLLASAVLCLKEDRLKTLMPYLISFATGTLLATGFVGILPEAAEELPLKLVMTVLLVGILSFMLLEKTLMWRHCHSENCEIHKASSYLIIVGDTLHNFFDGAAIAVSFAVSVPLGIATTVAVFAHEIPQETGDFAIMLAAGWSRTGTWFQAAWRCSARPRVFLRLIWWKE